MLLSTFSRHTMVFFAVIGTFVCNADSVYMGSIQHVYVASIYGEIYLKSIFLAHYHAVFHQCVIKVLYRSLGTVGNLKKLKYIALDDKKPRYLC
jgi:hypothetical protein